MSISIENKSPLGRRVTVSLDNHNLKESIASKMFELSNSVSLKGFRKGKIPKPLLEKRFGASVRAKALEDLISEHASSVIKDEKFKVAGRPAIEQVKELPDNKIEYILDFEIFPTIELRALSNLEVEKWSIDISDQDVESMIAKLKEKNGSEASLEKENVRKEMEEVAADTIQADIQEKILALLIEQYQVELPQSLIEQEREAVLREQGASDYSAEELKETVEKRVLLGLLATEYIEKKDLKVTPELIVEKVKKLTRFYPQEHIQAVVNAYLSNKSLLEGVERMVLLDQVVNSVLNEVKVVETPRNFHDVI